MPTTTTARTPLGQLLETKMAEHGLLPSMADAHAARVRCAAANRVDMPRTSNYRDTPHRATMRALLDAAGQAGATVFLTCFKADDTLRCLEGKVMPSADKTAKYVTLLDLVATEQIDEGNQYRRVCLDSITGINVTYRAGDAQA